MRGLTISAHGGLDRIELRDDLPTPALSSNAQVRVRVVAAALNHLDLFVVGGLPNVRITPPWILGSDAMGIVDQVATMRGLGVLALADADPARALAGFTDCVHDCEVYVRRAPTTHQPGGRT